MTGLLSDTSLKYMRWIACAAALLVFAFCIVKTIHWQIDWDQSVIRYVRFLMSHGMRPYSDITDMNMPGCYLMEAWGTAVFGWSDLSWRIYEYVLIATLAISGMVIGGRRYWLTGLYGSLIFLLVRFAEGETFSMERNEVMAMLDLIAVAFFFIAMQRRKPVLFGISSFLICLAATMKPWGYLLELILLGVLTVTLRREKVSLGRYLLWALAGNLVVALITIAFLVREHAFHGFLFIIFNVWPLFKKISPHQNLAAHLIPKALIPLTLLAIFAAYKNRATMGWQRWTLLLAAVSGIVSYKLEGSVVGYHRYVFIAFLATWIGWELTISMQRIEMKSRLVGVTGLVLLFGIVVPYYTLLIKRNVYTGTYIETYPAALQADLSSLGGDKLQGQVECLEMLEGCLRTLYDMRLVQNTGSTGDLLLFEPQNGPAVRYYRDWYTQSQSKNPANVVVLGNFWFQGDRRTFDKLNVWPQYADYLRDHYVLAKERHLGPGDAPAYRIYVRKGSDIPVPAASPGTTP